jgi:hypothetical protein
MIGFRLGDLWTDTFTYSKGKRAGEQGVSLKARLLFVGWIKVDGQLVYKAEAKDEKPAASREPAAPTVPAADEAVSDTGTVEEPALAETA